jgi:hypothetical protein
MGMALAVTVSEPGGTTSRRRWRMRRWALVLLFGGLLLCVLACGWFATWSTRAEHRLAVALQELRPPPDAVLLHSYEAGVSWPWSTCPYVFEGRIYGTQWTREEVIIYYDAMVPALGYHKCANFPSAVHSCYERPDGSNLSVGAPDYTDDEIVERYRGQFPTAFLVTLSWREPDVRARCREYQCTYESYP